MDSDRMRRSVHKCIEYYPYNGNPNWQSTLQASCKNSLDFVQRLEQYKCINVHSGCVNTVNWNNNGTYILSGSDDNHLVISEAATGRVAVKAKTLHKRHIFSARFMPHTNDQSVVSCSGEGVAIHTEFLLPYGRGKPTAAEALIAEEDCVTSVFDCHKFGSCYDVLPLPDAPCSFLSCGEDGTVRHFDLRTIARCTRRICHKNIYIMAHCAATAMDVGPLNPNNLAVGCSDSIVRLYDRRMLGSSNYEDQAARQVKTASVKAYPIPMRFTRRHYRPTCVKFSANETELLVSYSMDNVYLFDLKHPGYNDNDLVRSGCYTHKLRRDDETDIQMPRLRFRGDWSDTGPNSLTVSEQQATQSNVGQARPPLEPGVLSRLSDEIFRMLNSHSNSTRHMNPSLGSFQNSSMPMPWRNAMIVQEDTATDVIPRFVTMAEDPAPSASIATGAAATNEPEMATNDTEPTDNEHKLFITKFDYVIMCFKGHRNSRTMVKSASFWGDDFIISGSDCGHVFIWARATGKVVKTLLADSRVVNRVQPHPTLPYLLTSGIDYSIKIWAPTAAKPEFCEDRTNALIKTNEVMLVETRDTITVPAHIMIRILASLYQYRRLLNTSGEENEQASSAGAANSRAGRAGPANEAAAAPNPMEIETEAAPVLPANDNNENNNAG